jgi:hypothetical protein
MVTDQNSNDSSWCGRDRTASAATSLNAHFSTCDDPDRCPQFSVTASTAVLQV